MRRSTKQIVPTEGLDDFSISRACRRVLGAEIDIIPLIRPKLYMCPMRWFFFGFHVWAIVKTRTSQFNCRTRLDELGRLHKYEMGNRRIGLKRYTKIAGVSPNLSTPILIFPFQSCVWFAWHVLWTYNMCVLVSLISVRFSHNPVP